MATAPAKKRTRDPNRGRRILDAARDLFYERGFHAVSVDEIGEAAGATGAAIYRYFTNKEEILSTLFDEAQDRYLVAIPDESDDPVAELRELVRRHLEITLDQREMASIWAHEHRSLTGEHERRVDRRTREYLKRWVAIMQRCFPHRSERDLLYATIAATGTTNALIARPGRAVTDREAEIARQLIIAGLMSLADES